MLCNFCETNIDKQGLLVDTKDYKKKWVCSDCFVRLHIKGEATLVHHWGFTEEKAKEEPKPEEG